MPARKEFKNGWIVGVGSKTIGWVEEVKDAFNPENPNLEKLVTEAIEEAFQVIDDEEVKDIKVEVFKKGMALTALAVVVAQKKN